MSPPEPGRRRLGLRREVLILLPVALLLLVVLSTFTLFSYRNAVSLLTSERREEATRLARDAAARLAAAGATLISADDLRSLAPGASAIALVDAAGSPLAMAGEAPVDGISGFAPLAGGGARRYVRVDLPAAILAAQKRAVAVLSVSVLTINGALVVLVLFFLRHLLAPWETLLARARQVGGEGEPGADEVEFLLATFETALADLNSRPGPTVEEDIAALERTLSASLQSGLLLLGRDGRVLALNTVGAALLGTAPPEPGAPLTEVLAGQPELLEVLDAAVAAGTAPQRQECAVRSGRETLTVGLTVHPLRRDDGEVRGHLVLFADLTEAQRRAEESRLAESLAQLGEMAGGVAHELRNSLATLRATSPSSGAGPARTPSPTSSPRSGTRPTTWSGCWRISSPSPGRARAGAGFPSASPPARRRRPGPRRRGGGPRADPAGTALRGDPAAPRKGPAQPAAQCGGGGEGGRPAPAPWRWPSRSRKTGLEWRWQTGPRSAAGGAERLFHPFATGRPGGVGLGLALAHRIVVLHGGRIRLEDRPGGGTRALLAFPRDTIVTGGNETAAG